MIGSCFFVWIFYHYYDQQFSEKAKEHEKQREEEYYREHGHPIDNAEKRFFETVERMRKERETIYEEIKEQLKSWMLFLCWNS